MKKYLSLFLFFVIFVYNALAAPLVFKVTKEIKTDEKTEIAVIDTAKYKQLRLAVKAAVKSHITQSEYSSLLAQRSELNSELDKLRAQYRENHPEVLAKKEGIDKINTKIGKFNTHLPNASIVAVENENEVELISLDDIKINRSVVIDSPPAKIKILVKGQGKYTVYVWGQ